MGRKKLEPTVVISERVKARFQHEIRFKIKELIKKHYYDNMTTNEAIKAIKDYLRYSNVSENQFSSIVFDNQEAILNGKTIFNFSYDNGGMDLYTLDYENICGLNMDILAELFHDLYYKVYCQDCNGNHEDCDHSNVIYSL